MKQKSIHWGDKMIKASNNTCLTEKGGSSPDFWGLDQDVVTYPQEYQEACILLYQSESRQ